MMDRVRFALLPVVNSKWFSNMTTFVIVFYALVLGFKTYEEAEAVYGSAFFMMDRIVTIFFLIEVVLKMASEKRVVNYFKDGWNIFDFSIVAISLIPMNETDYALIARVLRVFRVLRLFTARPELKKIIDMLIKAIPSIVDIVLLMFIIFYIYAIVGSFIFADLKSGLWDNLLISMLTLFRVLTFEDWTDVMYEAMEVHPWAWIYFVSFVIIAAFVFFNLFVAVIIDEMQKMNNQDMADEIHEDSKKLDIIIKKMNQQEQLIKELQKNIERSKKEK